MTHPRQLTSNELRVARNSIDSGISIDVLALRYRTTVESLQAQLDLTRHTQWPVLGPPLAEMTTDLVRDSTERTRQLKDLSQWSQSRKEAD